MAALAIRAQPFFGNKNRAFWNLQTGGWAGVLLLRGLSGIANGLPLTFLIPVVISTITGYSLTLLLSVAYKGLIDRRPAVTWSVTAATVLVAAGFYALIDAWIYLAQNPLTETGLGTIFLGAVFLDFTMLAAWSALYYAINFFLRVEEQGDMLLRLETQATQAQLAMLRYQLNPHFLFNTLNSISTLVLLKQTEPANAMLSRLSSFLRHTLANEVLARVPLSQEIETLQLYLDIEKMRFEERLRVSFDIDPSAQDALLPSLLLQPLAENAIKYAVTPMEEGADISISAERDGEMVRIVVADTGPGTDSLQSRTDSTSVGLANIQERLNQAYGETHSFQVHSQPGQGFSVTIEIPYQIEAEVELMGIAPLLPEISLPTVGRKRAEAAGEQGKLKL